MYTSLFKVSVVLASFETETYVSTLCEPVSGVAEPEGDNPNKSENRFSHYALEKICIEAWLDIVEMKAVFNPFDNMFPDNRVDYTSPDGTIQKVNPDFLKLIMNRPDLKERFDSTGSIYSTEMPWEWLGLVIILVFLLNIRICTTIIRW